MISNVTAQLPPVIALKPEGNPSVKGALNVAEQENSPKKNDVNIGKLSDDQQAQVDQLKKTDREVRAHEAAHKNVGGQFAGSASYSYTVGPDGNRYAIGGEVPIDVAPIEGDPEATLAKLDVVIAAALAPAKPSAQDRKVAAAAIAARNQARGELAEKRKEDLENNIEEKPFDVNDFGETPSATANKAYTNGIDLGQESASSTGLNISVTS